MKDQRQDCIVWTDWMLLKIYEQFTTVVCLKEQVRATDPHWNDLVRHIQYGSRGRQHIELLRSLVLTTNSQVPRDFKLLGTSDHYRT
ncbi:uncharacterized protein F5147DRAFT_674703 [Suillus discolor]|uniref:Uncharacterized protein n=1 Tax=Suillus discolor TaxID=1912936 RepID=A0A9P7FGT2_9AGAM|nr:uncharacterized protein F5147DRAFT_674703 [Suillus discolor]KAG2115805.1 hypothetical protein F5147DRAFT_674703 [Suillus discolor]